MRYLLPFLTAVLTVLSGCAGLATAPAKPDAGQAATAAAAPPLRLVGMHAVAPDARVDGTLFGGISGIDYDAVRQEWLLVSDDRGQHGPARFFRARADFDNGKGSGVQVLSAQPLLQPDGSRYPRDGEPGMVADLEALRIDPRDGAIWVASEGDCKAGRASFVRRTDASGRHLAELPYPSLLQATPGCQRGGRNNLGMEGMSFSVDGQQLWLAMEAPVVEDGEPPGPEQGALTRISLVGRDGSMLAQYAYPLDRTATPAFAGGYVDNGISEILAIGPRRLLVLERAGRQVAASKYAFHVRLYEVDLAQASMLDPATPIGARREPPRPASKRLLFDSASLPAGWSDNYEALAWGPALASGRRPLVIASDNNFSGGPTRFLVFDAGGAYGDALSDAGKRE